ncbi:hypothetical protein PIB30_000042 [Stylosanthes scabra]|uniref:Uncharacterized protein n=1 Tax=Stylosanthes scabra TaxID=79078 RepID=A0ABU6Q1X8_9FABA|nr:hypothetical protein [Stylosanthes scabra]
MDLSSPNKTHTTDVESMMLQAGYAGLLMFFIKKCLLERRTLMPRMATLLEFYRENVTANKEEQEVEFARIVEMWQQNGMTWRGYHHYVVVIKNGDISAPYNLTKRRHLARRG